MAHGNSFGEHVGSLSIEVADKSPELLLDKGVTWWNWVNLVAYLINAIVTGLQNTGIWGAKNTELSRKYQTLITPMGAAFSIWGFIFLWEGIFTVAQFLPGLRNSKVTQAVSPWWWGVCAIQTLWNFAFAQEWITLAAMLMLGILLALLGISWSTDGMTMNIKEYGLLRAPFSLQLGWIIAAAVLNLNVLAEYNKYSQSTMLGLAIVSLAIVLVAVFFFTFNVKSADPLIGLVAAWALAFIGSELGPKGKENDRDQFSTPDGRFKRSDWDDVVLEGVSAATNILFYVCLLFVILATVRAVIKCTRPASEEQAQRMIQARV
jgi:hypothetical protein